MFGNDRYMTIGVQYEIPVELQLFMWYCIDTLKEQGKELDYIQVFELSKERADDVLYQNIEHRQEVPEYSMTYRLFPKELIDAKVFVIDDGDHSTMMLSNEY
ncbi:DUF960 domain-containing protein [Clostridium sp. P21]|uniref:DUF960 domain-containing protein n=1 Tax=Clostridium muellerianum TaxID=2716538 RepID=A0A7Y0EKN0_9CLOT|nr:DUF960 domain-containing protein [Clostridium muellerianum]NMM65136.1 DUF960 domain-containing protein [Clostridium muellerianum]